MAHVDAGKTTLSEAVLYLTGSIRRLGRVDHQDAFLDTDAMERARGITIFSKQAEFTLDGWQVTLLDTPGHVDFSPEMERTLRVLDYALLVISGADGVQGAGLHPLEAAEALPGAGFSVYQQDGSAGHRQAGAHGGDPAGTGQPLPWIFGADPQAPEMQEELALCMRGADEPVSGRGAGDGKRDPDPGPQPGSLPCYFGSALKVQGVEELLRGMERIHGAPPLSGSFRSQNF